jgi:hypothetical protein
MELEIRMHIQMDGFDDSVFTIHGSKIGKRKKRSRRRPAGGYTATRCSTLEGTANRAEKDRERFSGSTHAVPSSKFCA